jgi:hypothetical protein
MPLTTSKPEVIDDIEYPYMGLSMAMMPSWRERDMGAMVAAELTLFRIDEAGKIEIARIEGKPVTRSVSFGDAFASAEAAEAVATILGAVQAYITAQEV